MSLWRKLTVVWPAMLGDWLFLMLAVKPVEFMDRLTIRRVITLVFFVFFAFTFAEYIAIDAILILAGDAALYYELTMLVFLMAAKGRVRTVLYIAKCKIAEAARAITRRVHQVRHAVARARSTGIRKHFARKKCSDDEPGAVWAFA